jgi:small subunit ribosomal protein S6
LASHVYEGLFLFDSNKYARDANKLTTDLHGYIESRDGEILASRLWNEQKLAYPIKGQRKGTYWLAYFRLDSSHLSEISRDLKLNEAVLRNLVIKLDPRLVDAMVAHAKGEVLEPEASDDDAMPEIPAADAPAKAGGDTAKAEAPAEADADTAKADTDTAKADTDTAKADADTAEA